MVSPSAPLDAKAVGPADCGAFAGYHSTSNRRAVYIASGAGAQLIPLRFRHQ